MQPSSTVHISEIQILFVRGKTYEGSQCANQTAGGDKEDEVLVMILWQRLADKMPGQLRHTRGSKRHGSERQQWASDCHRPGIPTPLPAKDLVQCKKEMETTSFSSVARLRGRLYVTRHLFAFPESKKSISVREEEYFFFLITVSGVSYVSASR